MEVTGVWQPCVVVPLSSRKRKTHKTKSVLLYLLISKLAHGLHYWLRTWLMLSKEPMTTIKVTTTHIHVPGATRCPAARTWPRPGRVRKQSQTKEKPQGNLWQWDMAVDRLGPPQKKALCLGNRMPRRCLSSLSFKKLAEETNPFPTNCFLSSL